MRAIAIACLLAAGPAAAQTQAQRNAEAFAEWKGADGAMTREWKRTYAYMIARDAEDASRGGDFGYAAAALASQRAWLAFRDAQCAIEGGEFAGGSMQSLTRADCLSRISRERATQLRNLKWTR